MRENPSFIAKGNINTSRFVTLDGTNDFGVIQAVADSDPVGISQEGAKAAPIPSATTLAAESDDTLRVHGMGEEALLEVDGTGTAIVPGTYLKSDANGRGVPIVTSSTVTQNIGARALEGSTALGELIRVQVTFDQIAGTFALS